MDPQSFILALTRQAACYRRLAKLAESQHDHVQREDTESLLAVLELRQQVLTEIGELEGVVGPARRQWSEFAMSLDVPTRHAAEALLAEIRAMLEQITASDRDDALVLQQRKLNLGRQIGEATRARRVGQVYAAAAYGGRSTGTNVRT